MGVKKKLMSVTISFLIALSMFSYVLPVVKSASVSNVSATPGVVNCVVAFTCSDSTDTIKIYYGKSPGITTGDNVTYVCGYNAATSDDTYFTIDTTNRKMIIWGITEETTYYYRIYSTKDSDWCADESSFTTLPRFTDVWKDEFYDTYLISDSSNVGVVQLDGTPDPNNPLISLVDSTGHTIRNVLKYENNTPKLEGGKYVIFVDSFNATDQYHQYYWHSDDLQTWEDRTLITTQKLIAPVTYTDGEYKKWGLIAGGAYYYNCSTYNGTWQAYAGNPILDVSDYKGAECGMEETLNDTLGATPYRVLGQDRPDDGTAYRTVGKRYGFNSTHWITFDGESGRGVNDSFFLNVDIRWLIAFHNGNTFQPYSGGGEMRSGCYLRYQGYYDKNQGETNTIFFLVSRNGQNYTFVDSIYTNAKALVIPSSNSDDWDYGRVIPDTKGTVVVGDYQYFYYVGYGVLHGDPNYKMQIGRTIWRKDGITCIKPSGSFGYFVTTAIPSKFVANFTVNGNFSNSAKLNVSVVNATTNNVYQGFGFSDFNTIITNSTSISPTWGSRTLANIPEGAFKLNFSFDGAGSGELYAYEMDEGDHQEVEAIQFISIDGGINGTTIYDTTPTFNWTVVVDTSQYHLQVSNTSGDWSDSSLVVNLSDINVYNYPDKYNENATRVSFTLPDEYALPSVGTYYCRVRAYVKGAG